MSQKSNGDSSCRCEKFQYPPIPPSLSAGRETELKSLLRSFSNPTNSVAVSTLLSTVEDDIVKCDRNLADFERERKRLDGIILALQNQKARLKAFSDASASLKASIRRIPKEVLQRIFLQLEPQCFIGPDGTQVDAFRLAAVCASWRDVALSTRLLWCNVVLDMEAPDESNEWQEHFLHDILRRSGQCPLSIRLTSVKHPALFEALVVHAHRWSNVEMEDDYIDGLDLPLTRLRSLDIPYFVAPAFEPSSASIRTLERLRVYWKESNDSFAVPTALLLWLRHLAIYDIAFEMNEVNTLLSIIAQCNSLESLLLDSCCHSSPQEISGALPTVSIKNLKLRDCVQGFVEIMLRSLCLPRLETLTLDNILNAEEDSPTVALPVEELSGMVARSSPVMKTIAIHQLVPNLNDVATLLSLFPTVESLSYELKRESDDNDTEEHIMVFGQFKKFFRSLNPNLGTPLTKPLLPKLSQLSISLTGVPLGLFPITEFVKMLGARWTPEAVFDSTTCLKSVKVKGYTAPPIDRGSSDTLDTLRAAGMVVDLQD